MYIMDPFFEYAGPIFWARKPTAKQESVCRWNQARNWARMR